MSDYYISRGNSQMIFHREHITDVSTFRPVAVIDFEDREAVERLTRLFVRVEAHPGHFDGMQAALREFADPTPPRIPEPGMWGVVEASCVHSDTRRTFVHGARGWNGTDERSEPDPWDDLIDPVLIREGVAQ